MDRFTRNDILANIVVKNMEYGSVSGAIEDMMSALEEQPDELAFVTRISNDEDSIKILDDITTACWQDIKAKVEDLRLEHLQS